MDVLRRYTPSWPRTHTRQFVLGCLFRPRRSRPGAGPLPRPFARRRLARIQPSPPLASSCPAKPPSTRRPSCGPLPCLKRRRTAWVRLAAWCLPARLPTCRSTPFTSRPATPTRRAGPRAASKPGDEASYTDPLARPGTRTLRCNRPGNPDDPTAVDQSLAIKFAQYTDPAGHGVTNIGHEGRLFLDAVENGYVSNTPQGLGTMLAYLSMGDVRPDGSLTGRPAGISQYFNDWFTASATAANV